MYSCLCISACFLADSGAVCCCAFLFLFSFYAGNIINCSLRYICCCFLLILCVRITPTVRSLCVCFRGIVAITRSIRTLRRSITSGIGWVLALLLTSSVLLFYALSCFVRLVSRLLSTIIVTYCCLICLLTFRGVACVF